MSAHPRTQQIIGELREALAAGHDAEDRARIYLASPEYTATILAGFRRLREIVSGPGPMTSDRALYVMGQVTQLVQSLDGAQRIVDAADHLREKLRKMEGATLP